MRMLAPEGAWEDSFYDVGYALIAINTPEKGAAVTCLLNTVPVEQGRIINLLLLHTNLHCILISILAIFGGPGIFYLYFKKYSRLIVHYMR